MKIWIHRRTNWDGEVLAERFYEYAGPVGQAGGGGQTVNQSTAVPTGPWGPQIPYIQQLFSEANNLYQSGGPQYYGGQTVADRPASLTDANASIQQYGEGQAAAAQGAQQQAAGAGAAVAAPATPNVGAYSNTLGATQNNQLTQVGTAVQPGVTSAINTALAGAGQGGQVTAAPTGVGSANATPAVESLLSGGANPYLDQIIDAATRGMSRRYTQDVLPGIRDQATAVQPGGGSRAGIAEGIASGQYTQDVGDTIYRLLSDSYGQDRQAQLGAAQLVSSAQQGDASRSLDAARLNEMIRAGYSSDALRAAGLGTGALESGYGTALSGGSQIGNLLATAGSQGLQGLGMLPGLSAMGMEGLNASQGIGLQDLAYNQQLTDADIARWNYNQLLPYQLLTQFQNCLTRPFGSTLYPLVRPNAPGAGGGGVAPGVVIPPGGYFGVPQPLPIPQPLPPDPIPT